MAINYTKAQQQVIDLRNRNLLVSASAGSGKTAVLVQRIIEMVSDEEQAIDIDELLIVTFTNAAASEMKQRISKALESKIQKEPDNQRLKRQYVLVNHANIMTIHAYCLSVIKTYYNDIDLDPSFRIGDTIEVELLKKEVLEELLEDYYTAKSEGFLRFVDAYAVGKKDDGIETLILDLYKFSRSNLWPEKWLDRSLELLNVDRESYKELQFYQEMLIDVREQLEEVMEGLSRAGKLCIEEGGPDFFSGIVDYYLASCSEIYEEVLTGDYSGIKVAFDQLTFQRLSSKKKGYDLALIQGVKDILGHAKGVLTDLKSTYFIYSEEEMLSDISCTYEHLEQLVILVKDFMIRFQELKKEKNIIDFSDIEHFALKILVDDEGEPTEVAIDYREQIKEILIDEYQDSNIIQETILTAISREPLGRPNVFMVGDVKQSIYKFRLAKPELFMEKFKRYSEEESDYQLIQLDQNFRSRETVINSTNYVFEQLMSETVGDLTYDEKVYLKKGAKYEEGNDDYKPEVLIVDRAINENDDMKAAEIEANMIADRIREMIDSKMLIYDKDEDAYRSLQYKDIVVLLRSAAGNVDTFIEQFNKHQIPVYANSNTGYFEAVEIKVLLNVLKIIDNPRQDIPLVSVLRSPIVGLNENELAMIRTCFKNGEYYLALKTYLEGSIGEDNTFNKVKIFYEQLNKWRKLSKVISIDELINTIFNDTQYDLYVTLMSNGLQRKANIDIFIDRAINFEKTSYRGVFNFIRYIEKMKQYEMDMGEASLASDQDDLVKIMTIHKSKGLEFPVVFVSRLDKKFNYMDLYKRIVFHQDAGFAGDYIDHEKRFAVKTLPKTMIALKNKRELLSEEMRVLYVALTRAREKLILTGVSKDFKKEIEELSEQLYNGKVRERVLLNKNSFLSWLMYGVLSQVEGTKHFKLKLVSDINVDGVNEAQEYILEDMHEDERIINNHVREKLEYQYPYSEMNRYPVTMSVSDIKRKVLEETMEAYETPKSIPEFMVGAQAMTGAEKGTIYHKVMYHLPVGELKGYDEVTRFINSLVERKILTNREKECIYVKHINRFLKSSIAKRIAENKEQVRRETPFVLGIPINEMYGNEGIDSDEIVMMQGVIDLYFIEDGDIVLVDYKTDYVKEGLEEELANKYQMQMTYYKKALETITGLTVKETILYALNIGKEISV